MRSWWVIAFVFGILVLEGTITPFQESGSWDGDSEDGESEYALVIP